MWDLSPHGKACSWFEKQHFWKGRFLESLPLQHLQYQPLNFLNWQDHSEQHPLCGKGRNQLLASIWLKIIKIILNKQQIFTEMVTDAIIHSYRTLLLYTYFKVREKVTIEKGNFKGKITTDQHLYNQYFLSITTSNEKLPSGKKVVHMLYMLYLSLLTGLYSYCSQP